MKTMAVFISFVLFCVCLFVYLVEDIRKEFVQTSDYGEVKASFAGPRISWFLNKKRLMRNADKYFFLQLRWPFKWLLIELRYPEKILPSSGWEILVESDDVWIVGDDYDLVSSLFMISLKEWTEEEP